MKVSISKTENVFFVQDYAASKTGTDNHTILKAGFKWNPLLERYETSKLKNAAALRDYHDDGCVKLFEQIECRVLSPWSGGAIQVPKGERLDKHQRQGVLNILERNHFYIAFEQGVGKTPTAICAMNTLKEKTLILLPPHLIPMWEREIEKWSTKPKQVKVFRGQSDFDFTSVDVCLVPDSMVGHPLVVNPLHRVGFGFLIVEEAQRFTQPTAQRTQALFGNPDTLTPNGLVHSIPKVVFLSGTPMPNRPIELFPVLRACGANLIDYRDKEDFGIRYCKAYLGAFGWDYRGSSNETELGRKIHNVFMQREEKDAKFAEKTRRIVYLNTHKPAAIKGFENAVLQGKSIGEYVTLMQSGNIDVDQKQNLGAIAEYRNHVGKKKVTLAAKWIEDILKNTDESVLVIGWHTWPIAMLARALDPWHPLTIQGKTNSETKDSRIERFQKGHTRVLLAQMLTMVGYNIDKATRVVFFENSWVPSHMEQAEDRAHRRTSKHAVLVEYLCLQDTLDEAMLEAVLRKKKTINKIISKGRAR